MINKKISAAMMMPVEMLLKNGRKKHGILLDTKPFSEITSCQFVCNSKLQDFEKTNNHSLVEIIPFNIVASIDTFIR